MLKGQPVYEFEVRDRDRTFVRTGASVTIEDGRAVIRDRKGRIKFIAPEFLSVRRLYGRISR